VVIKILANREQKEYLGGRMDLELNEFWKPSASEQSVLHPGGDELCA
jgi:hypothetical protein